MHVFTIPLSLFVVEYSSATTTGFIIGYNFNVESGTFLRIYGFSLFYPMFAPYPLSFFVEATIGFVIGHNISMWKMGFSLKWVLSLTSTKIQKKERNTNTHDIRVAA
jgi:hypothetical protein